MSYVYVSSRCLVSFLICAYTPYRYVGVMYEVVYNAEIVRNCPDRLPNPTHFRLGIFWDFLGFSDFFTEFILKTRESRSEENALKIIMNIHIVVFHPLCRISHPGGVLCKSQYLG